MCIYSYICKCIVKWFTITNQIRIRDYLREESANESFSCTSVLWIPKWKYILSITNAIKNNCRAGRAILIRLLQKLVPERHRCSYPMVWWKKILSQSIGSSGGFWCLSFPGRLNMLFSIWLHLHLICFIFLPYFLALGKLSVLGFGILISFLFLCLLMGSCGSQHQELQDRYHIKLQVE